MQVCNTEAPATAQEKNVSIELLRAAFSLRCTISATQRYVLTCLAWHANKDAIAWPSLGRIADETSLRRSAIIEALDDLEARKFLDVVHQGGQQRHPIYGRCTAYHVNIPKPRKNGPRALFIEGSDSWTLSVRQPDPNGPPDGPLASASRTPKDHLCAHEKDQASAAARPRDLFQQVAAARAEGAYAIGPFVDDLEYCAMMAIDDEFDPVLVDEGVNFIRAQGLDGDDNATMLQFWRKLWDIAFEHDEEAAYAILARIEQPEGHPAG